MTDASAPATTGGAGAALPSAAPWAGVAAAAAGGRLRRRALAQGHFETLRQAGPRCDGRAVGHVARLANLEHVRGRRQLQRLCHGALCHAVDEQLCVRGRGAHRHLAEDRHELELDDLAAARGDAEVAARRFVALTQHRDRLLDVRADVDVERRAPAVGAADCDVGAGRRAPHRQPSIRQAETHGPERERLVRLHLHVAHPGLEPFEPQFEAVRAGHELEVERSLTAHLAADARLRAGGFGGDRDLGPGGRELGLELLQAAEAFDLDLDRGIEVALGVDGHGVTPRRQLERPRRVTGRPAVDAHPTGDRQHDLEATRQRLEREAEPLVAVGGDVHRDAERQVALALGDERVGARPQQVTGAEAQPAPAALERHALGLRGDLDLHGHCREDDGCDRDQQRKRRTQRQATPRHGPRWRRALGIGAAKRDGLDAFVLGRREAAHGRHRLRRRWRGPVAGASGDHFEHAPAFLEPELEPATAAVEHVAAAQPRGARDGRAVVQHRAGLVGRLHEQLPVVQADPRQRAGGRRQDDVRAGTAERQREVAGPEHPLAQGLAQDEDRAQIGSSQRIARVGASRPGSSVSSRRTSR
jgi:hypothetical protein